MIHLHALGGSPADACLTGISTYLAMERNKDKAARGRGRAKEGRETGRGGKNDYGDTSERQALGRESEAIEANAQAKKLRRGGRSIIDTGARKKQRGREFWVAYRLLLHKAES